MRRWAIPILVVGGVAALTVPAAALLGGRGTSPSRPVSRSADPSPGAEPGPGSTVVYQPPVAAPVIDPFRPPATPYGPGNRGLEYATAPGTTVGAAADGVVTFAGQVGGQLFVTVAHADGVRTSYAYLASVAVRAGERVHRGDPLGTTGRRFHLGARRDGQYVDPATLWAGAARVVLVPLSG